MGKLKGCMVYLRCTPNKSWLCARQFQVVPRFSDSSGDLLVKGEQAAKQKEVELMKHNIIPSTGPDRY